MNTFPSVRKTLLAASLTSYVGIASGQSLTIPSPACSDLVTGSDEITIGEVCTEIVVDNVEVTITMENFTANECCLKETHICNYPAMAYNISEECRTNYTYNLPIDELEMFGFVCESDCQDMFQLDGHATILCDGKALPGDDAPYGDPLEGGVGTGIYPGIEKCYGAMFWIMFTCEGCAEQKCIPEPHEFINYNSNSDSSDYYGGAEDEDKALCDQPLGQDDKYCYTLEFEGCSQDDILEGCITEGELPAGFPYTCEGQNYTLSADLYVDCEDEFPFGYGEFGAPVFMEGPRLRSYRFTKLKDPDETDCRVDKVCYGTICDDNKVCVPEQQKVKFEEDSYVPDSIDEICNKTSRSEGDDRYLYLEFETGEIFEIFFDKDDGDDLVFEVGNFNLTGLHLSCSDKFVGGYGEKGPPNQADGHPRIVEYQIAKLEDDNGECRVKEICCGCPEPTEEGTGCIDEANADELTPQEKSLYEEVCTKEFSSDREKIYYDFTFQAINGTNYTAMGWSAGNEVEPMVTQPSGSLENVHVSCSDGFLTAAAGPGYGEKASPKFSEGEPPVKDFLIVKYKDDAENCVIDKVCRYCPQA